MTGPAAVKFIQPAHHTDRNAMEITFKAVLALFSCPLAIGIERLPLSLKEAPTFGRISVILLFVGCVVSLAGILWRDRDDGLIMQQAGLTGVAFGSLFYASALAVASSQYSQVALVCGLFGGVGFGAVARFIQLQSYVKRRISEANEDDAAQATQDTATAADTERLERHPDPNHDASEGQ